MDTLPLHKGSAYPEPYAGQMSGRSSHRLAKDAGLTQFAVNIVYLEPGAPASLRHWHLKEDEFAMVLTGELVLIEDDGETMMRPCDCAAWKAGEPNAHHFVNRTDQPASFLVVGTSHPEEVVTYGDVDMKIHVQRPGPSRFTHHDGSDWAGPRDLPKGDKT
jgi:uncharacterized cupin superfamily protein